MVEQMLNTSASQSIEPTVYSTLSPACSVRVLVVDDDPLVLQMVTKMTQQLGCQTTMAEDALMALHYLQKDRFDVVITDYNMPFIDGCELADQIKETYFGTKVIIMTGHCEAEVMSSIEGTGVVDGLLLKPFNIKAIKEKIENVLRPQTEQRRLPEWGFANSF